MKGIYQPVAKVVTAFDRPCIPADRVAIRSHMSNMLPHRALSGGRRNGLGVRGTFTTGCYVLLAAHLLAGTAALGYKSVEIRAKEAREYAAHQESQNLVIAAHPCDTRHEARKLFDTDKFARKRILPVLIVVENNNDFVVSLDGRAIFLIDPAGNQHRPLHYLDVLADLNDKRRPPISDFPPRVPGRRGSRTRKIASQEMLADFEQKSFGEKLIAPYAKDFGVVFYEIPWDGWDLSKSRFYIPEVYNFSAREPLVFFEFEVR